VCFSPPATSLGDCASRGAAFFRSLLGAGKEVTIALVGEGAHLAKKAIAKSVHGVGVQPLHEVIAKVVEGKIPVYV
jgi:predicted peroxiredoxin